MSHGGLIAAISISFAIAGLSAFSERALAAASTSVNQQTAQEQAEAINRRGSDQSLESSTTYGMQALMDLSSLNIPGAINNGTQAYGKYRNSEDMDELGDQQRALRNSMGSGGSSVGSKSETETTYRRLNSQFLYEGKAGEVAAEFEKRSGMKREAFLQELSTISENKIDPDDPRLVDKVVSRFEAFTAKIPNAQFRANIEKGISMIPASARTGLIAQGIQKFSSYLADSGSGANSMKSASMGSIEDKGLSAKTASKKDEPSQDKAKPAVAAAAAPQKGKSLNDLKPLLIGLNDDNMGDPKELNKIVQDAIDTQKKDDEDSIFVQVSKRYRMVTPQLAKSAI